MLNDPTLNSIEYRSEHLFNDQSSNFSSQKSFLSNTEHIFHNSSTSLNLNNDIVENIAQYFNSNDQHSNISHPSSPFSYKNPQFHFILNVPPSLSSRLNEETTTYLNQGQPYEIKFHINKIKTENLSIPSIDYSIPTTYRSILRLCFWDKTLQQQESELMQKWVHEYHLSSLFDIDMNLTYGILSIIRSKQIPNAVEIVWDTLTTASVFIRFKCTSTDFAQKRHGGEKGIPLRIQIDTYHEKTDDRIDHVHSCCCKIQLFRLKGAQRKNKADKMKLEKLNLDQRRQYQTTFEYTILQSCFVSPLYTLNLISISQSPDDLFDVCTTSLHEEDLLIRKKEFDDIENKDEILNGNNPIRDLSPSLSNIKSNSPQFSNFQSKITIHSSNEDVLNWLNTNHFSSLVNRFQHYTGLDLLRLTRNDIQQICNGDDAISIRFYHQLNETIIPPLKTFYIKLTNNDIYSAIYLHTLTRYELREKLFQLIQQPQQDTCNLILELDKIKIKIDNDNVVKYSLPNEGQFYLKILPYELILYLLNRSN
jgi:transcription factor CP2-like protein